MTPRFELDHLRPRRRPSPRRRSRPASTSWRRRSATSPTSRLRALSTSPAPTRPRRGHPRVAHPVHRYGLDTPLSPYHEHNAAEARPRALRRFAEGQALALISDAGTPLVSDPGFELVAEALDAGLRSRRAGRLRGACRPLRRRLADRSILLRGFSAARSAARRERINALAAVPGTLVFYEAPSRLAETLATSRRLDPGRRRCARTHQALRRGPARGA